VTEVSRVDPVAAEGAAGWPERAARLVEGKGYWLCLFAVMLLATALRLPGLAERSLWLDESYSVWFASLPLHELWTDAPLYETHPPVYYTLLKGWIALFGDGEAAIRSLSVAASAANVLLLALAGRLLRLGPRGDRIALLAALLLALNPSVVVYAQEARPYALQMLAATSALLAALRLAGLSGAGTAPPSALSTAMLGLSAGAMLWLHNTSLFIAFGIWVGLGLGILVGEREYRVRRLVHAFAAGLLALAIWSPFLPMLIAQTRGVTATAFWVRAEIVDLWSGWNLAAGGSPILAPVLVAALLGLVALGQRSRPAALVTAAVLLLPISATLVVHFMLRPIFIDRLFVWMAAPLALLTAIGLVESRMAWVPRLALAVLVVGLSLTASARRPAQEDWRDIVTTIAAESKPGDMIVALPNEIDPALTYYAKRYPAMPDAIHVPGPFPYRQAGRVYIGNLGAPRIEDTDAASLSAETASARRIWLITRRADLYDPEGITRRTVNAGRALKLSFDAGPISIMLFE
jgi:uncharacterized membrane protein